MNIHLATDHAGFELKELVKAHLEAQGYSVLDHGAHEYAAGDDYPALVAPAVHAAIGETEGRAIIFGGSGQGEAMVANRIPGARAIVFYGFPLQSAPDAAGHDLDIVRAGRAHNDANVLSIGARYAAMDEVLRAIDVWIHEPFSGEEHHRRRIGDIDRITAAV